MDFREVSVALDCVRLLASGWDISIGDAIEKIRKRNAFPTLYKLLEQGKTPRQVANAIRKTMI